MIAGEIQHSSLSKTLVLAQRFVAVRRGGSQRDVAVLPLHDQRISGQQQLRDRQLRAPFHRAIGGIHAHQFSLRLIRAVEIPLIEDRRADFRLQRRAGPGGFVSPSGVNVPPVLLVSSSLSPSMSGSGMTGYSAFVHGRLHCTLPSAGSTIFNAVAPSMARRGLPSWVKRTGFACPPAAPPVPQRKAPVFLLSATPVAPAFRISASPIMSGAPA